MIEASVWDRGEGLALRQHKMVCLMQDIGAEFTSPRPRHTPHHSSYLRGLFDVEGQRYPVSSGGKLKAVCLALCFYSPED